MYSRKITIAHVAEIVRLELPVVIAVLVNSSLMDRPSCVNQLESTIMNQRKNTF